MTGNTSYLAPDLVKENASGSLGNDEATGMVFEQGPATTGVLVETPTKESTPASKLSASLSIDDRKAIIHAYNKVITANRADGPKPGQKRFLSSLEQKQAQKVSGGNTLNPRSTLLTPLMLSHMLLFFKMLDKRNALSNIPKIRSEDVALIRKMNGEKPASRLRFSLGRNRRMRAGAYAELNEQLRGPKPKMQKVVFVPGQENAERFDRSAGLLDTPAKTAVLDSKLTRKAAAQRRRFRLGGTPGMYSAVQKAWEEQLAPAKKLYAQRPEPTKGRKPKEEVPTI